MTKTSKPTTPAPSESAQLDLFIPVPDDAVARVLKKLYDLATEGNTAAAKLFLDVMKLHSAEPDTLTPEAALKLLQDHFKQAA